MVRYIMYYAEKGGVINGLIFLVCFVIIYIGIGRLLYYRRFARSKAAAYSRDRVLAAVRGDTSAVGEDWFLRTFVEWKKNGDGDSAQYYTNRFREMLLEHVPRLENGLSAMAAFISVAPLLGLFGTVVGMIRTFSIITEYGMGNPNLLSEGISVSLLTTQAGLLVAFPSLLFHNYLNGKKETIVKGMLADGEQIIGWFTRGQNDA
jgi:biopolymer transport protein ExbB